MIQQKTSTLDGEHVRLSVIGLGAGDRVKLRAEGPSLLVGLEASVARVEAGHSHTLDRSGCLVLPGGVRAVLRAAATSSRVALLGFQEPLMRLVERTYRKLGVDRRRLERWFERVELLPRTLWVHEIVHRYVFERWALGEHRNTATRFLETEILKEIYFLFRDRDEGAERTTTLRRHSAPVERVLGYVEAHLFEPCTVRKLAQIACASESTLLRAFRRELGSSPGQYWRERRLEEALVLLRSGRHSIADVATRVGYDHPTAFGFAFRRRFGRAPSSFVPRRPARRAP
jgi:AraC-like DNA-binding protein